MRDIDLGKLSAREIQVLDLAVRGLTDAQVAHKLGIKIGTVHGYWVRIRGKLGHLTRTEFVACTIRARARAKIAEIHSAGQSREAAGEPSESDTVELGFEALTLPTMIWTARGDVVLANAELRRILGFERGEMRGKSVESFFPKEQADLLVGLAEDTSSLPALIGRESALQIRQRDGRLLPAVLSVGAETRSGRVVCAGTVLATGSESDSTLIDF